MDVSQESSDTIKTLNRIRFPYQMHGCYPKETVLEVRAEYDPSKKTKPKNPGELEDWLADLNPQSKTVTPNAYALAKTIIEGYFVVDKDSTPEKPVFNPTVTLRDSYNKSGKREDLLLGQVPKDEISLWTLSEHWYEYVFDCEWTIKPNSIES
ncbi:hypothetical protein F8388_026000 [Cannabis sativa]|uniref:Uncharacterized protein n=2 Tax=Cannabis sativa TaxID=3483 RepID=A0A7J6EC44_CANSA|nr:hypothetical protein F8388_026000 [Cannabis sativa]